MSTPQQGKSRVKSRDTAVKRASAKQPATTPGSGKPRSPTRSSASSPIARGRDHGVPRSLGQPTWELELDASAASACGAVVPADGLPALISAFRKPSFIEAANSLCVTLKEGGHDLAEVACEHGAVEASLLLVHACDVNAARLATEALWYLCDDYSSCQRLIQADGHRILFKAAREQGPKSATVAMRSFRLLTSTLYNETRGSEVWQTVDAALFVEALEWALRADLEMVQGEGEESAVGFVCDVAALWVLRVCALAGPQAARPLLRIVPLLLERMAMRQEDVYLQEHGCRLLWSLANTIREWPEDIQHPALAALGQLAAPLQFSMNLGARAYSKMAFQTVVALKQGGESTSLSSMD